MKYVLAIAAIIAILYFAAAAGLDLIDNDTTRWAGQEQTQTAEQTAVGRIVGGFLLAAVVVSAITAPAWYRAGYRRGP